MFLLAATAALAVLMVGKPLLVLFFGEPFAAVEPVLFMALVALADEGLTGQSDDLVRVANRDGHVLAIQTGPSVVCVGLVFAAASLGTIPAMGTYIAYYYIFAAIMLLWAQRCLNEIHHAASLKGAAQ